jgi:hypothetical protein
MSRPPLPPLEERDGSRACATADDKDWIPAEVAIQVDGTWTTLETVLRPELAVRAGAVPKHKGGAKGAALSTQAFVRALAAYLDAGEDLDESWPCETFARKVEAFALRRGISDAHLIKPRNHAIRQLAGCALEGIRQTRQRDRR